MPAGVDPERLPELSRKACLAVFGGSFDPVHTGHLYIAGEVIRRELADEVLFVPSRIPPHKQDRLLSPAEHRLGMLRLATQEHAAFSVSDIELQRENEASYTIHTLELLETAYADHRLCFVMGMDSLRELHTWYRATEIISRFGIIVFPRPGVDPVSHGILAGRFGPRLARRLVDAVVDVSPMPIAATDIRRFAMEGRTLAGLTPDSVQRYIHEHRLYGARR
jgi:nicotinate-nucleotide adenylyltransferase